MRARWFVIAPLALAGMALFAFLGGVIVRSLWNWLGPPLFGLHTITFWQAFGLLVLCRILFGNFGMSPRSRPQFASPEERERYRQRMRERWGFGRPGGGGSGSGSGGETQAL